MTDQVAVNIVQGLASVGGLAVTGFVGYMVKRLGTRTEEHVKSVAEQSIMVRTDLINANIKNYEKINALIAELAMIHGLLDDIATRLPTEKTTSP